MTMSWHMMVEFEPPLVACVVSEANFSFAAYRNIPGLWDATCWAMKIGARKPLGNGDTSSHTHQCPLSEAPMTKIRPFLRLSKARLRPSLREINPGVAVQTVEPSPLGPF